MKSYLHLLSLVLLLLLFALRVSAEGESPMTDAEIVAFVDEVGKEAINSKATVGVSIAVERGGKLVVAKGYGYADLENEVPATEKTVYRIGSITKQFTAAAIMKLMEEGKVGLEDDIIKFFPNYPTQGNKVTVYQLLNHTSGIKSYTGMGDAFWKINRLDYPRDDMVKLFSEQPFDFKPGEKYRYNNSGYYLLGMIVEKASGQSYEDYLKENIFKPAGLEATYYLAERPIVKHRAEGYSKSEGDFVNDEMLSMDNPYSAGSLGSTAVDLIKWTRALAEGKVVSSESYKLMTTRGKLNNGEEFGYGFGLATGSLGPHPTIEHGGGINGFSTQLAHYPDAKLTVCVLTNTQGSNPTAIEKKIARKILNVTVPELQNLPLASEEMDVYIGKYVEDKTEIFIYKTRDRLMLRVPSDGTNTPLLYQGEHTFAFAGNPERRITFIVENGKAKRFTLEQGAARITAERAD